MEATNQRTIHFLSRYDSKLKEIEPLFVDSLCRFELNQEIEIEDGEHLDQKIEQFVSKVKNASSSLSAECFAEIRWLEGESINIINSSYDDRRIFTLSKQQKLHILVVYVDKNAHTTKFESTLNGTIATEPKGQSEQIIDRWFVPEGYTKTLAELGHHLCLENEPYLELADMLRTHRFFGTMEIHIFVAPLNPSVEVQQQFKATCAQVSQQLQDAGETGGMMKCCNLRLDFVDHGWIAVLMSSRYVRGDMKHIWKETFKDARVLTQLGFDVIRTKIEATASIEGVPALDSEAKQLPAKTYFEFHMVFSNQDGTTPNDDQVQQVKDLAKSLEKEWNMCIPLSTNAFGTQRFLNMRTYGIGKDTAFPRLELLGKHVQELGYVVPRHIREFGVYDSAVMVDAGWLEPPQPLDGPINGFLPPIKTIS